LERNRNGNIHNNMAITFDFFSLFMACFMVVDICVLE